MGKTYPSIDETLAAFLRRQHVFFVATAPLSSAGHVNLSPKGLNSFVLLDPQTVASLDLTGSGIETVAERQGAHGLRGYREQNDARSIDGLPGLRKRWTSPP